MHNIMLYTEWRHRYNTVHLLKNGATIYRHEGDAKSPERSNAMRGCVKQ